MKKFLVLSAIVGLAGIGVGLAGHQSEPSATLVETAADVTTTSTPIAPAAATETSSTTIRKTAAKIAPKVTTTTRPVAGLSLTTAITAAPVTTTTAPASTITTTGALSPTCTATAANPSVHKGDTQTISVVSNMPTTKTRMTIQYPKFDTGRPNPRLEYTLTTDAAGTVSKSFSVSETSTVPAAVSIQFYDAAGHLVSGCQTNFEAR